jgi:alanyl-tRNA synthetase
LFDDERQQVDHLTGGSGYAALATTPFYVEAGGQVSDRGRFTFSGGQADVSGVVRLGPGLPRAHRLERLTGELRLGDEVRADVDVSLRDATRRNHTATHLLHATLRQVLGPHVKQAGSLVAPERLRFDFVSFDAVTSAELSRIERIVNEQILANSPVQTDVRSTDEAIAAGAMALFGEKYGDRVRVVTIPGGPVEGEVSAGPFSVELCGGTHVSATGDIGLFLITEESGVAAGVRRIEAVTGLGAYSYARERLDSLNEATRTLNARPRELADAINAHLTSESKLKKEVQQLKTRLALGGGGAGGGADEQVDLDGVTLISRRVDDVDKDSLRSLADTLKSRLKSGVVVLAAPSSEGKVTIIATVTPDLVKRTPAGQLVKQLAPIVGGGGGGRPDFAEAGGKDPSKIGDMLAATRKLVEGMLASS